MWKLLAQQDVISELLDKPFAARTICEQKDIFHLQSRIFLDVHCGYNHILLIMKIPFKRTFLVCFFILYIVLEHPKYLAALPFNKIVLLEQPPRLHYCQNFC